MPQINSLRENKTESLLQREASCRICDLGLIEHAAAYQVQQNMLKEALATKINTLIFCEHPPVLTLGRIATEEHFLFSQKEIREKGVQIVRIDRGGEVTFHGPGQLVIYPIFCLEDFGKDLKVYLKQLEQVAIDLLRCFDILAHSIEGKRGVWVGNQKIASIGIGVRKWISFHGMAVNVNTDLNYFSLIKPCGLDVQMVSMEKFLNRRIVLKEVKAKAIQCFAKNFNLKFI